ncbi:uncharacterized protein N7482_002629 [Penicillium canariense]|uniref:Uncharacterized protein n=1 Tax=Penicillium canariense TaxID=189055 RepID=A0A9W9IHX3_9EURO|nr:uncharacterized protein N7482_002629 [Penicillium canariense]KAJ5176752.1 hypothetical protein N7482_002629 [Penicillium canariense]
MSRTTEDTPLLLDPTADELGSPNDERYTPIVERHQQRCTKTIFILTWSSALLAVFILVLDLTIIFIFLARFGNIMPWAPEGTLVTLLWTLLAAGLISFLNLARLYLWNRPIWLWLNLILDLAIAVLSIGIGLSNLGLDGSAWDADIPLWFIRIAQVVSGLAVVFGLIHLALFLVRCFLSFSYRPWREYRNWTFPRGRFSIEFKVQFMRQSDNAEASPDATASVTGIQAELAAQRV